MNYPGFRDLLREAIDRMPQKEFSERSGISREHLNRMLNSEEISRPSKTTLRKVLKAAPNVNPNDLYRSCDYEPSDCRMDMHRMRRGLSLKERLELTANDIEAGFRSMMKEVTLYPDLRKIVHTYMTKYAVDVKRITYGCDDMELVSGNGDFIMPCVAYWSASKDARHFYTVKSYFALCYMRSCKGGVVLTDVVFDPAVLLSYGFLPQCCVDSLYEDGTDVRQLPFFAVALLKEHQGETAEERLLRSIFGDPADKERNLPLYNTIWGRGSVWKETPAGFVDFLLENERYFHQSEEENEILEEFMGDRDADPDVVCADYLFETRGTVGVVLAVLHRKFMDKKYAFEVDFDRSEQYEDKLPPVLYVSEEHYCDREHIDSAKMDLIDEVLMAEFRLLKLPTYGQTLVYKYYDVNPDEYLEGQKPLV